MDKIIIKVDGMMCTGCENRIQNSLKMIGIKAIASHENKTVTIENEIFNLEQIENLITNLGFKIIK